MQSVTFIGEVQGGRLYIQHPLADFEGKQVLVTLIAPPAPLQKAVVTAPFEDSISELDVEVEVYAAMPVPSENLGPRAVRTVAANPCMIFPETIVDE